MFVLLYTMYTYVLKEGNSLKYLDRINSPDDLKKLNTHQLETLCGEIRRMLIETVAENGGHLASNLGVVELTTALLTVFNLPEDKIVYDVGHQSYVHKILTGRKDCFSTLRKYGGISGFPKTAESEYDAFNTGHSSTAVSVALAIAEANKMDKKDAYSIALVGDASFSNGLTMEGLNNAGRSNTNMLIILNDNEMSIGKNVGSLHKYLNDLRTTQKYNLLKKNIKDSLSESQIGTKLSKVLHSTKSGIKKMLLKNTMFEDLGFTYVGPVDGHNLEELITVLKRVKNLKQPVLLHVTTIKGKGYGFAEKEPNIYHGISSFDSNKPVKCVSNENSYSNIFGTALCEIAQNNKDVVAICAAMQEGTGLNGFAKMYPDRFFDVGISEGHAVTFASGLASMGKVPVVAIYSTFMQRAYDNLLHDAAIGNYHVVFCLDRAGITGADGETHHGVFDISFASHIPNVKIFMPYTANELKDALERAIYKENGPCVIRYPKGVAPLGETGNIDKLKCVANGNKATIVTIASTVEEVKKADLDADVFYITSLSPVDTESLKKSLEKTNLLITVEDSLVAGGMGECVSRALTKEGILVKTIHEGLENFVSHGSIKELLKEQRLDFESLREKYSDLRKDK